MTQTRKFETSSYNAVSVWIHWLSALLIIFMFVSGIQGDPLTSVHISLGVVAGLALILRVIYRLAKGIPALPADAGPATSKNAVIWLLLALIVTIVVSGLMMPWASNQPIEWFNYLLNPPVSQFSQNLIASVHTLASYSLVPLILLHIVFTPDAERMFESSNDGR